jgi:adenine phosphoribosyltransferase
MNERKTYSVEVGGVKRDLPLFEIAPDTRIAILNILGDIEFVEACAEEFAMKFSSIPHDYLVTPEAKSIPLAQELAKKVGKSYIVLRKSYKPYMGMALQTTTKSITAGKEQVLYLDEKDCNKLQGKRVILIDDVVSTGSTQQSMRQLMDQVGAEIVAEAAIFTEGDESQWEGIISLGHLPIFKDE